MDSNEVRKIIREELSKLTHSNLSGMPDFGSFNRDHDNSYHRKNANLLLEDFFIEGKEITAPGAPDTNKARIYIKDDSGTTKLCMKDSAGNERIFTYGGFTPSSAPALTDLTDVGTVVYTDGYVLQADGTNMDVAQLSHTKLSDIGSNAHSAIDSHIGSSSNPHSVTAGQVGAATTSTKLDDFATPDDNTDLNATTTHHGLLPKLDNNATNFLNGQGSWAAPAGVTDHGVLTGLSDDDHTQYHNDTRGDARYSLTGHAHAATYAPIGSAFLTNTADATLTNEINLGALSTGLLKGTVDGGVSTISAITDSSTNWDAAYSHSQDNTQAHSDYLLNSGDDSMAGVLTAYGLKLNTAPSVANGSELHTSQSIFSSTNYDNVEFASYIYPTYSPSSSTTVGKIAIGGYAGIGNANWGAGSYIAGLFFGPYCGSGSVGSSSLNSYGVYTWGVGAPGGTVTVANSYGLFASPWAQLWGGKIIATSAAGVYVPAAGAVGSGGSITTLYGSYLEAQTVGGTNWQYYSVGGASKLIQNASGATNPPLILVQDHTSGAQPCLTLDQDDESEGFIDFLGSDRGAIATSTTDSTGSIRVEINGTVRRIPFYADA